MTLIKQISFTGFKSFGNRTVTIKLAPGFTCIVGPNGAGKSNVIDGLCFCLGRLSKKTMRAKQLTDLIWAGNKTSKAGRRAAVKIVFDNTAREFPTESDEYTIERSINTKGRGKYRVNNKVSTRTEILNALAAANIDPNGGNQFVLQGRITELTHMSIDNRREFIEELIGLEKYDKMRDATMKELEKADKDLGRFEAIFSEISKQLRAVEKERNDALKWKELDEAIKLYNAQLIALRIQKLREEEEELEAEIEETQLVIRELSDRVENVKNEIEQLSFEVQKLETEISAKEEERNGLEEKLSNLKAELSAKQTGLENMHERRQRLVDRQTKLEEQQAPLEEGQTYDDLISDTKATIADLEQQTKQTTKEIEENSAEQKRVESEINEINQEKAELFNQISEIKQKISALKSEIKVLKRHIKKSQGAKKKQEKELSALKKDEESVEEAMEAATGEVEAIKTKIEEFRKEIEKENEKQKELEKQIADVEEKKAALDKKISDIKSYISSLNAEINLHEERIKQLAARKKELETEYNNLKGGKSVKEAIDQAKKERTALQKEIEGLRKEMQDEALKQKKLETEKEKLEGERQRLESQLAEQKARVSSANSELKIFKKEVTKLDREKKTLEMNVSSTDTGLAAIEKEIKKTQKKITAVQKRIEKYQEEKARVQDQIDRSEKEQNKNQEDIRGTLEILGMLTQNISYSVEEIKSKMQEASQDALSTSTQSIKGYISDISEILSAIEDTEGDKQSMTSIVETMKMLTSGDAVETQVGSIMEQVADANDVAVQESTAEFDRFVQDIMDLFDNLHFMLRKLSVTSAAELYQSLDQIQDELNKQLETNSDLGSTLKMKEAEKAQNEAELKKLKASLDGVVKSLEDYGKKTELREKDIEKTQQAMEKNEARLEEIATALTGTKEDQGNFWERNKELQDEIEDRTKKLEDVQDKLRDLKDVENLLKEMENIDAEVAELKEKITGNKKSITESNDSMDKVNKEKADLQAEIDALKVEKEKFWDATEAIQAKIEKENANLEKAQDKVRALENVQKLIASIEQLEQDIQENVQKIADNEGTIETHEGEIAEIDKLVEDKDGTIAEKNTEKEGLRAEQKDFQSHLADLNKQAQEHQKSLSEQEAMKKRADEIAEILRDLEKTDTAIVEFEEAIQNTNETIQEKSDERAQVIEQIQELNKKREGFWAKSKEYQDQLSDLNTKLGVENTKLSGFESRKTVCADKIELLFDQSKDYGALPDVTDDLSEPTLQQNIEQASKEKEALEPVNLRAIEQYEVVKERFDEIDMRRQALQRERKAILDSIDRIELEKTRTFMKAYHEINRAFSRTFQKLSPGGSAKMLLERPDKPFEGGIMIEARPRGKKISSLDILSGGEKTLVALSFIFAVQTFSPAPFYVMDEIDAALDGPNVHRVSMVIREFALESQFIVISHREENIVNADIIYGVSQTDGLTDIFSVNLEQEKKRIEPEEGVAAG